jgi:hypothetical protein
MFPNCTTYTWSNPNTTNVPVCSYPSFKWFGTTGARAITQLDTLTADYNVTFSADNIDNNDNGPLDVAWDIWLYNAAHSSSPDGKAEIMIMIQPMKWQTQQAGNYQITTSRWGSGTKVFVYDVGWLLVQVVPPPGSAYSTSGTLSGTMDILNVLKALIGGGTLTGNETLNQINGDIHFGAEVMAGRGTYTLNSLTYKEVWLQP